MTQAFNLSQFANKVNTSGQADLATAVSGTLPVANGGTGAATLTANNVLLGNGTGAVQAVAPSTSGNVLTSNGSSWASAAPPVSSGALIGYNVYTTTGANTYTKATNNPSFVIVEVQAGGGGCAATGTNANSSTSGGGGGAYGRKKILASALAASVTVTVGAGGVLNATGGTSSFGSFVSCTGGAGSGTAGGGNAVAAGGTSTGGDINITGGNGIKLPTYAVLVGGSSFMSNSVRSLPVTAATAGLVYGGGAGGAWTGSATSVAGANGGQGIVIVWEYR
jgi:hypothetical protein